LEQRIRTRSKQSNQINSFEQRIRTRYKQSKEQFKPNSNQLIKTQHHKTQQSIAIQNLPIDLINQSISRSEGGEKEFL
jgi:hypothetical protein